MARRCCSLSGRSSRSQARSQRAHAQVVVARRRRWHIAALQHGHRCDGQHARRGAANCASGPSDCRARRLVPGGGSPAAGGATLAGAQRLDAHAGRKFSVKNRRVRATRAPSAESGPASAATSCRRRPPVQTWCRMQQEAGSKSVLRVRHRQHRRPMVFNSWKSAEMAIAEPPPMHLVYALACVRV
eukprot:363740-Chlamydomonas_euryale.AAC.3